MEVIWTSKTPDMGQTLNNVWAVGQIRTSPLLLSFGLKTAFLDLDESIKVVDLCLTESM